jgi:HlyD family secretion protein
VKRKVIAGLVVLALLGIFLYERAGNTSGSTKLSALRTVTVQRGLVQQTASAPGNVTAPTDIALNFQNAGTVLAVMVQPGQTVSAGQVLAKEDPTTAQNNLAEAQANLTAANARLEQLTQGVTPQQKAQDQIAVVQAQAAISQADQALAAAQAFAAQDATNQQAAVAQAQQSLAAAQAFAAQDATNLQAAVTAAQAQQSADQAATPPNQAKLASDAAALNAAVNAQQAAALKDQQSVQQAENTLANAENAQQTAALKDQQSVQQAQNALTNTQNGLAATLAANALKEAPALPGDLATAQAAVQTAQVAVQAAQLTLNETTLVAPSAGVVADVSYQVGEVAPGGGNSSSTTNLTTSAASATAAAKAFIDLTGVNNLEVVAGFAETDAVNIQPNQPATISFNALPSLSLPGHVLVVDSQPTTVSNVVTYNVTIVFDRASPLVRNGMSTNVSVVVNQVNNALYLPNLAIRTVGGASTVSTLVNGKQQAVTIATGLQGDTETQILSGLAEGTTVVVPSLTLPTTTAPGGGRGGGLGGGGLNRLGG